MTDDLKNVPAPVENNGVLPRVASLAIRAPHLAIRRGEAADLAWIDQMQRIHAGKLGFMWAKAIEKRLAQQMVLVAVDDNGCQHGFTMWGEGYSGREDCTVCFQLAVAPAHFRRLIGASLVTHWLKSVPHGTRLAACWCAQDLPANNFWQAMGFQALAWRTGSRGKQRPHIWWVRRVRIDDHFPLWFPAKTSGGSIGEERLVIPILPAQHWSDPVPTLLPMGAGEGMNAAGLPDLTNEQTARVKMAALSKSERPQVAVAGRLGVANEPRPVVTAQGIKFLGGASPPPPFGGRAKQRVKRVTDPEMRRKCRDLRDRYLEALESGQINVPQLGKYEVGRVVDTSRLLGGLESNRAAQSLPAASAGVPTTGGSSQ
jgi:hypothetical protein